MFFVNAALNDISIGTAGLVALLGYAVVFIGLIALMVVVMIMGKVMSAKKTVLCYTLIWYVLLWGLMLYCWNIPITWQQRSVLMKTLTEII